jgi:hypothetical protein
MNERCAICDCILNREGNYARPTPQGRAHASKHHYVAERFFGRSSNRRGEQRERVFETCPWNLEKQFNIYCYECHEELLHNPVLLPEDISKFAELARSLDLNEDEKPVNHTKLAGRIQLLHEVIAIGLREFGRTGGKYSG